MKAPTPAAVHLEAGADCVVRCVTCLLEARVSFAARLRAGWPVCHGATMRLLTDVPLATVTAAVDALLPPAAVRCTEVSASWCPVHGWCSCPDREEAMDSPTCPLHAPDSAHAEPLAAAVSQGLVPPRPSAAAPPAAAEPDPRLRRLHLWARRGGPKRRGRPRLGLVCLRPGCATQRRRAPGRRWEYSIGGPAWSQWTLVQPRCIG